MGLSDLVIGPFGRGVPVDQKPTFFIKRSSSSSEEEVSDEGLDTVPIRAAPSVFCLEQLAFLVRLFCCCISHVGLFNDDV